MTSGLLSHRASEPILVDLLPLQSEPTSQKIRLMGSGDKWTGENKTELDLFVFYMFSYRLSSNDFNHEDLVEN
jgi:hypothetical protein